MNPSGNPMEIVSALMQERQRYESWLVTLEQRKSDTPPHVYERVRADYDARLQGVMSQLAERTSEMQETISVLEARLARVLAEENSRRDAKYEAELRAAVGEYTTTEWNDLLRKSDEEIARLSTDRGGIATELARVRQIYAMANTRKHEEQTALSLGGAAGRGTAAHDREPGKGDAKKEAGARRSRDVASGAATPAGFDELAFLNSLGEAGARQGGGGAASPPAPSAQSDGSSAGGPAVPPAGGTARQPTPSSATAGIPKSDAPAPVRPDAARPTPAQPVAAQGAPPAPPAPAKPAAKPAPKPEPKLEVTRSKRDTNGVPSFLKDVPEQIKTLKCAECGTMNYPTEWYCERCGGELAAM